MAEAKTTTAVTVLRIKALTKRLDGIAYGYRNAARKKAAVKDTPEIAKMRLTLGRHDAKADVRERRAADKAAEHVKYVRNVITFGDLPTAVKLVENIEKELQNA
jgi:hypothetical protein